MNDFFDSLKDIKKELIKEQEGANLSSNSNAKQGAKNEKQNLKPEPKTFSKEEAIAHKEQILQDEFLAYVKDADIKKC